MSAGHGANATGPITMPMLLLRFLALSAIYLELVAIPSALVLIYRRVKIFLVFLTLPILLSYALLFTGKVVRMFV